MVKAVKPFVYKNNINFKVAIYNAWVETGGKKVDARPYEFLYKSLSHHLSLPTLFQNKSKYAFAFVRLSVCDLIRFLITCATKLSLCFGIVGQVFSIRLQDG